MKLVMSDGSEHVANRVKATNDYVAAGAQDVVILAMKAHQVESVANDVPKLFGPETIVVTMQNGIPYWYFHEHGGELAGSIVRSVDPTGLNRRNIPAERVIGCVVYPAPSWLRRGRETHRGYRFPVGELDGSGSMRATRISECFTKAGFKAPVLDDIRAEIWLKLWGNLTFNPISALTRSTLVDICQYPGTRELAAAMMTEAQTIAHKLGITFRMGLESASPAPESRQAQDIDVAGRRSGRAPEIDALVGSVVELGRLYAYAYAAYRRGLRAHQIARSKHRSGWRSGGNPVSEPRPVGANGLITIGGTATVRPPKT